MDEIIVTTLGGRQRILGQAAMIRDRIRARAVLYQSGHNLYWSINPHSTADRMICHALDFYNYGAKIDGRIDAGWAGAAAPTDYFIYTPSPPLT